MTLVVRQPLDEVSADTNSLIKVSQVAGELFASVDLDPVIFCYIGTDGLVYPSGAVGLDAPEGGVIGVTARGTLAGEPVTLYSPGARFRYGLSLTPGQPLYLMAGVGTPGRLDDAPNVADDLGIAFAVSDTDIVFARTRTKNDPL